LHGFPPLLWVYEALRIVTVGLVALACQSEATCFRTTCFLGANCDEGLFTDGADFCVDFPSAKTFPQPDTVWTTLAPEVMLGHAEGIRADFALERGALCYLGRSDLGAPGFQGFWGQRFATPFRLRLTC
jgi:hypothetical protein